MTHDAKRIALLPDFVHRTSPLGHEIAITPSVRRVRAAAWNTAEDAHTELELLLYHTSKLGTDRIADCVQWGITGQSHGGLDHDASLRSGITVPSYGSGYTGPVPMWSLPANGVRVRFAASRATVVVELSSQGEPGEVGYGKSDITEVTFRASLHPVTGGPGHALPGAHYNGVVYRPAGEPRAGMDSSARARSHAIGAREFRAYCDDPTREIVLLDCSYQVLHRIAVGSCMDWTPLDARSMCWAVFLDDTVGDNLLVSGALVTVSYR